MILVIKGFGWSLAPPPPWLGGGSGFLVGGSWLGGAGPLTVPPGLGNACLPHRTSEMAEHLQGTRESEMKNYFLKDLFG